MILHSAEVRVEEIGDHENPVAAIAGGLCHHSISPFSSHANGLLPEPSINMQACTSQLQNQTGKSNPDANADSIEASARCSSPPRHCRSASQHSPELHLRKFLAHLNDKQNPKSRSRPHKSRITTEMKLDEQHRNRSEKIVPPSGLRYARFMHSRPITHGLTKDVRGRRMRTPKWFENRGFVDAGELKKA